MNAASLAQQRQELQARSAMHRLRLRRDIHDLGESLHWKRTAVAVATAPAIRTLAIGFALSWLGFDRVARWVKLAGRVVMFAQLAHAAIGAVRNRASPSACAAVQTAAEIPRNLGS